MGGVFGDVDLGEEGGAVAHGDAVLELGVAGLGATGEGVLPEQKAGEDCKGKDGQGGDGPGAGSGHVAEDYAMGAAGIEGVMRGQGRKA